MATPAILYQSSSRMDAKPFGKPRRRYPLPPESFIQFAAYAFDQDFEMRLDHFPPAAKNTPANATAAGVSIFGLLDANAILTGLSQPSTSGAGMGKFNGTFNIVPASWDDFKTLAFTPPGIIGSIGSATARDINPVKITTRLRYDYFVVDPDGLTAGILDSAGGAVSRVSTPAAIPQIFKSYFCNTIAGTPEFSSHVNSLTPSGGITVGVNTYVQTLPTSTTYLSWITKATASGWSSVIWNAINELQSDVGQFIADDSWLEPYAGNIWARITPYVLAR